MGKNLKLVQIDWVDSRQPISHWQWVDEMEKSSIVECSSVGWLVEDGTVKVLAANMGDTGDKKKQVSGVIQIPAQSVVRIRKLTF